MKKFLIVLGAVFLLSPSLVMAVSSNGNGASNGNAANATSISTSSASVAGSSSSISSASSASQNRNQVQTNNPGVGVMSQNQVRTEAQLKVEIQASQPQYMPKNSNGILHRSQVANAVQEMLQVANKTENQGIGQQVRVIAQTQSQNQDKIGQSIDNAEKRSSFAKFFIGANFKELKVAKHSLVENQNQLKELQKIMDSLAADADKVAIADQIIALQQTQLELKDQISELSGGFSLFGWMNRWYNKF